MGSDRKADLTSLNEEFRKRIPQQMLIRLRQLSRHMFLVGQLVKVNITSTYKRSFIGLTWMVITPIIAVIAWVLLHGAGIMNPGETDIPYPAYVLLSTSIWTFFLGAYQASSKVLVEGTRLMVTVRFPHEVLILEKILVHVINFVIPFLINLLVLSLYGISFTWESLLFPLTLIPLLLLGLGIGMIVSLLRVVAVDVARLIDKAMQFLMFITPIVYAPKVSMPGLATVVSYNPLTYLVGFSRDILTKGEFYEPQRYFMVVLGVLLFLFFSFWFFIKLERQLIERTINV